MNPLHIPKWKEKPKLPERTGNNQSLGYLAEAINVDKDAKHHVIIQVVDAPGAPPGIYKLAFVEGQSLGEYLRRLRLKRIACYSAVYDIKSQNTGRLRLAYIPTKDSHIVIGSSGLSMATQYQRSSADAQKLAFNMGGGKQIVEAKK